ncbi:MAG: hypothetical protein BM555_05965, partial [Crocinitomix sp. MedPE-SWsnd]
MLAVVLFHLSESSRTEFGFTFIESFSNFGYAGVDLFFVISGFIIFYTSSKYLENKKPFQFLLKRLLRLYPVYWIVFGGLFSAALLLGDSSSMSASFQMGDLPGSLSLWFGHEMINGVSWSLSYELFFYVLFFLVLLNRKFILIGIAVLCLAIVNLFFAPTWLTEGVLQYLTNPFLIEFAFGVLAGYLVKQKIGGVYIGVLGLVLLFAGGILYDHQISRIFLYGITSFLIVLGFSSWESKSKHTFKFLRLPTLIGDASYSMYLIHLPLLRIAHKMTAGQVNSEWASYLFNILIILLIIGVSIGFYLLIEKPLI